MGCHTDIINPPGYVMENYDAIGAWQTVDKLGNGAIDPVATVNFGDGNTKQIHNAQELMTELASIKKGQAMYAQNWVSFAYARDPNPNDQCVANTIATNLGANGPILNVLADLTQADSFRCASVLPERRGVQNMKTRIQTKNLPPGPGRSDRRCAVSHLRRRARSEGADGAKPKQFIAMFTHYGCITTKFFPAKSHGALAATDLMATNLAALAPYAEQDPHSSRHPRDERVDAEQQRLRRLGGGARAGERSPPERGGIVLHPASRSRPAAPIRSASTRRTSSTPCRSDSSLDHVMAQQLSPQGTPLFMRVGNRNDTARSRAFRT